MQTMVSGMINSRCENAERSIAAMDATTIRSNITPEMRASMKLLRYCLRPRLVSPLSTLRTRIAITVPMRKLNPQISGLTVLVKNPPSLSSPREQRYIAPYAAM